MFDKLVDYLSDELLAENTGDDDEPSTLKNMYSEEEEEDEESLGSLKEFIVSDNSDDEFEDEIEQNSKNTDKSDVGTQNIITGKRTRRKPKPLYEPDSPLYEALVLGDVDVDHYNETFEKDLAKIEEEEDDTDSYNPPDEENSSEIENMDLDSSSSDEDESYYDN